MTPLTDAGRIFTGWLIGCLLYSKLICLLVFYGLLGIPLMFITAADIGKFLSDLVIRTYSKLLAICTWGASLADAIRDYIIQPDDESIESRFCFYTHMLIGNYLFVLSQSPFFLHRKLRERRKQRRRRLDEDEDEEDEDRERLQLPIFSYFALVVGYCAIGSALFNAWEEGAVW